MTIGPEPMMRIFEMSVRLGMVLHHLEKLLEQIVGVVRTGRSFRVILDTVSRQGFVFHAFNRLIIEIDMRNSNLLGQSARIDGESVILSRDFDFIQVGVENGLVPSVMTELQFEGAASKCESHDLVTQANPEAVSYTHLRAHETPEH